MLKEDKDIAVGCVILIGSFLLAAAITAFVFGFVFHAGWRLIR